MEKLYSLFLLILVLLVSTVEIFSQEKVFDDETILMVVDVQESFAERMGVEPIEETFLQNVNQVISKFNPNNVVYIKGIMRVLSVSFRGIRVDTLPDVDFDKRLVMVSDNKFTKAKADAFTSDDFAAFIKDRNPQKIVVIGLAADQCVFQTILGGQELGYEMAAIPEALISKTEKKKMKAIKKLAKKGVKIINIDGF
ncbi:MAG TPA: isochorismatase family protein [Tenuifilaceae bacterium]|nr:isochorismatase family protein [Tenuifilaceae bacterium]HPE18783.1 isochorismatase family protein [Tenuifilaceae bacterium]HPJ46059.1 isochorismatase family protein [Tenuifilaceae bacterium]HPQ34243.1 isochorismatase family protein [Tenuifilaceae bacterium]HRX69212.1 isochorismatase family protein [Tenuifilaceae bacterium]